MKNVFLRLAIVTLALFWSCSEDDADIIDNVDTEVLEEDGDNTEDDNIEEDSFVIVEVIDNTTPLPTTENLTSYSLTEEDHAIVVSELSGIPGYEELVENLSNYGNFNRSSGSSTWGDYQLLQAISAVLNTNFEPVEGSVITVSYQAYNGGGTDSETQTVQFIDGEFEYYVEDVFVGGELNTTFTIPTEIADYYSEITTTSSTANLFGLLNDITVDAHTMDLSYTPGVWDTLMDSDVNPNDSSEVLLIYGFNEEENQQDSRTRGIDDISTDTGGSPDLWNREHVFPRSLGNPNLDDIGPGADAHHLRPADPSTNSSRGNKKFSDGSGIESFATSNGGWFPGDEWKGDVARMMMYMYVRYQGRCLPSAVAIGTYNSIDSNMVDLFLEWNIEDPVSDFEKNRNNVIENAQGNRNPFIDNPYLATLIWGGSAAENTWE